MVPNRVALVTGGSRGLGARVSPARGGRVGGGGQLPPDRRGRAGGRRRSAQAGGVAEAFGADVVDEAAVPTLVARGRAALGPVAASSRTPPARSRGRPRGAHLARPSRPAGVLRQEPDAAGAGRAARHARCRLRPGDLDRIRHGRSGLAAAGRPTPPRRPPRSDCSKVWAHELGPTTSRSIWCRRAGSRSSDIRALDTIDYAAEVPLGRIGTPDDIAGDGRVPCLRRGRFRHRSADHRQRRARPLTHHARHGGDPALLDSSG